MKTLISFLIKTGVMDRKELSYYTRKSNNTAKKSELPNSSTNGKNSDTSDIKYDVLASKNPTLSHPKPSSDIDVISVESECIKDVSQCNNFKTSAKQAESCVATLKNVQHKLVESENMNLLRETDRAPLQFGKSRFSAAISIENCPMKISDTHFDTIKEQLKIALSKRPSKVDPCDIIKSHLKMLYKKVYSSKSEKEKIPKIHGTKDVVQTTESSSTPNDQLSFLENSFSDMEASIDPYNSKNEFVLGKDEIIKNVASKLSAEYDEENAVSVIEEIFSNIAITKRGSPN